MVVIVKVRIKVQEREVITAALLNSGFESEEPCIAIPVKVAQKLNLLPPPPEAEFEEFETAGGITYGYAVKGAKVSLIAGEEEKPPINCRIIVLFQIDQVLLSDFAIDALGIRVLSFKKGTWRHKDDPEDVVRESER